jgi:tRNA G18 (ribose-2'-O)-methylase SpoU
MPRLPIDDLDDPRLAMYRHLKATNLTRGSDQFVVEGETLVGRLLDSRFPVASVLTTDRLEPRVAPRVPEGVPVFVVPHDRIEALVGFNFHRGVLACGRRRPWPDPGEIARASGPRSAVVVCPRIDNPENLGAVVRIADVFGADAVLAGGRCPDPLSRRVLRVSMGSALRVPVIRPDDLASEVGRLRRDHGFETVATVTDPAAEPLGRFRRSGRLALFLGSEGHGLEPAWLALCDRRLTIPMRPGAESLNVAVAAGIVLHQLLLRGPDEAVPGRTR